MLVLNLTQKVHLGKEKPTPHSRKDLHIPHLVLHSLLLHAGRRITSPSSLVYTNLHQNHLCSNLLTISANEHKSLGPLFLDFGELLASLTINSVNVTHHLNFTTTPQLLTFTTRPSPHWVFFLHPNRWLFLLCSSSLQAHQNQSSSDSGSPLLEFTPTPLYSTFSCIIMSASPTRLLPSNPLHFHFSIVRKEMHYISSQEEGG